MPKKAASTRRMPYKSPGRDLRRHYRITLEIGLIAALLALIGLMRMPMETAEPFQAIEAAQEVVAIEEVQQTQQAQKPPPPPRPPVPIEVPNEAVVDEEPLNLDVSLDIADDPVDLPPPPPAPEEEAPEVVEEEVFVVVEEMPEIIGGIERLYELLEYPDIARKAGVEGRVIVQFVVEPNGRPSNLEIMRSAGATLDQAALEAIMKLEFKPGRQRMKPVRVKFAIPIVFKLEKAAIR